MTINEAGTDEARRSSEGATEIWLPRDVKSPGRARAQLLQLLHEVEGGERFADAGAVIVTELVANAVQHGPRGDKKILVRLWVDDQGLRIEVHDASSVRPTVREVATLDERGRGMHLVMALSQQWGCCPRTPGIGKIVWAIVPPARGGC